MKQSVKLVVNWITSELFAILKKNNIEITNSPINPNNLGKLIKMITSNKISGKIAKEVFAVMQQSGVSPATIVEDKGLKQVTDTGAIDSIIVSILDSHPKQVAEYRGGKENLIGFFVGQVMKQTQGKANPKIVNQLLREKLS